MMTGNQYAELTADWGAADFWQHAIKSERQIYTTAICGKYDPFDNLKSYYPRWISEEELYKDCMATITVWEGENAEAEWYRKHTRIWGGISKMKRLFFPWLMGLERSRRVESRRTGNETPPFIEWRVRQ